jgi:pyruvate kinase
MVTKIITTIGPSSSGFPVLQKMKKNGANIGRINTKYGNEKDWNKIIKDLKKLKFEVMIDIIGTKNLDWVNTKKIDFLAVSFSNSKQQIKSIRKKINKSNVKIIAKIESQKGTENVDEIISASDGLMVARGDLSKNISFEKVPYFKRLIIKKCKEQNKFVIVATEMLLSMVSSKKPTMSEVDDVFEGVVDGANALMLSEETTIGKHPVIVVKTMKKIIKSAEKYIKNYF